MYITGVELVKQNRFAKISEGNKEKGPEQAKVFFGSTNHFMKNGRVLNFCKLIWLRFANLTLSFFV